jgi:hypothetical protein
MWCWWLYSKEKIQEAVQNRAHLKIRFTGLTSLVLRKCPLVSKAIVGAYLATFSPPPGCLPVCPSARLPVYPSTRLPVYRSTGLQVFRCRQVDL